MNTLHVPFGYFPDTKGGTEVYVNALCQALKKTGWGVSIAAPGSDNAHYQYEDVSVHRYAVNPSMPPSVVVGTDLIALKNFESIIEALKPDIVHFHGLTAGISNKTVLACKARGIKTLATYHTPTVSCATGTLIKNKREICNGLLNQNECYKCALNADGWSERTAALTQQTPRWLRAGLSSMTRGRVQRLLQQEELIRCRHQRTRSYLQAVDHIIALCNWTEELLLINGIAPDRFTLIRHGLPHQVLTTAEAKTNPSRKFRLAYFGRINATKGVEIVTAALKRLDDDIRLDIYGLIDSDSDYHRDLRHSICDVDVTFCDPVPPDQVLQVMTEYDLIVIPSQWLETGPFVALEALSAGTPLLVSRLGGLAEIAAENGNIRTVADYSCPNAWADSLRDLIAHRDKLEPEAVKVRTFDLVTQEHITLYQNLLNQEA